MIEIKFLTFVIAMGGWLVVIVQTLIGYWERKNNHKDEILLKAADYFAGGTQKRSIGISLIEGMIKLNKKYYAVIIPLLTNQFVYLLLQSNTESPIHEERNLVRIFSLLKEMISSDEEQFLYSKCEILDAIHRRLEGNEQSSLIISSVTLDIWRGELDDK
jgi:hypothetical protein